MITGKKADRPLAKTKVAKMTNTQTHTVPRRQPNAPSSAHELDPLVERVVSILEEAQFRIVRSVNSAMVLA